MAKKSAPASKNGGDKNLGASHIALVSNSTKVSYADTHRIAKALQKQVTRDFAPAWHRKAPIKVKAFRLAAKIPAATPVLLTCSDTDSQAKCDAEQPLIDALKHTALTEVKLQGVNHVLRDDPSDSVANLTKQGPLSPQVVGALDVFVSK